MLEPSDRPTPKVGDTVNVFGETEIISSVCTEREMFWAAHDTLTYWFEDVAEDFDKPGNWLLLWE